jgi:hypothetical protein
VPVVLPEPGFYRCERCRLTFQVAIGSPRPPQAAAPPAPWTPPATYAPPSYAPTPAHATLDPSLQAPCAHHPGNAASHVCERCGDFMCRLCATPVEGRLYCPRCFDLMFSRGAFQFAQRQFTLPYVAFGLGLGGLGLSLLCVCVNLALSIPLAIAAIWTGVRSIREIRIRPELPNRGWAVAGVALGATALLVSAGWAVFFIVVIARG